MKNTKGFTLVEILLAVMIVGIVGIALAALTSAAVRESNVGRTRMMLRNQISVAMRQLRQDVLESSGGSASGGTLMLQQERAIGPAHQAAAVSYSFSGNTITRTKDDHSRVWVSNIKSGNSSFVSPQFLFIHQGSGDAPVNSVLRVRLIVGFTDSKPIVTETVEETFILPHGFSITHDVVD